MATLMRWFFVLLVGFGTTWWALVARRRALQGAAPPPEFVANFGLFAAISTAVAAVLLLALLLEARRASKIPLPSPHPLAALFFWAFLAGTAVFDVPQSIGSYMFQWNELFNHLCAVAGMVGVYGVALAMQLPEVAGARLGKR